MFATIRLSSTSFVIALSVAVSGCAGFRKASNDMGKWTPDPLMPRLDAPVDLIALLSNGERATTDIATIPFDVQLAKEIALFNAGNQDTAVARRNLLQDRIKVSADQICDEYKSNVMRKQARANFWLGTTSLFLGTAGALVKGLDAARALSGGAAFTTGVRSEYNQDYYLDQTIAVITKAIDQKQKEIYAIAQSKREKGLAEYSVVQAVDDISRYHASCSLSGALSLTDKAVQSYDVVKAVREAVAAETEFKKIGK